MLNQPPEGRGFPPKDNQIYLVLLACCQLVHQMVLPNLISTLIQEEHSPGKSRREMQGCESNYHNGISWEWKQCVQPNTI